MDGADPAGVVMKDLAALRERISFYRRLLQKPEHLTAGFIALPSTHRTFPDSIPVPYQEFLREADGLACGDVLLYQSDDILQQQAPAKDMPGGRARWFCIGSLGDNPLFIEVRSLAVYSLPLEGEFDPDDALGELDYFLLTYVFGPDYKEFSLNACDDEWLALVLEQNAA